MTHVFIEKENEQRIKMIDALTMEEAFIKLAERLREENKGRSISEYRFGYYI